MNQIVVGIDFSKNSIHALEYAVNLASKVGANVHMIWINNVLSSEHVFDSLESDIKKDKKHNFERLIKQYQPLLKNNEISYKLKSGKVHIEMYNFAANLKADLMIIGTHGISGFEEYWIGSNAYRIVTHSPCPVISLRYGFSLEREIKKIILPLDSSQETKLKLPYTIELAQLLNSEIHVLGLYTTNLKSLNNRVDNFARHTIDELNKKNIFNSLKTIQTENMTQSTIDFAAEIDADMVAIMTEQENTTANLFLGPFAQQLINHSPVPILSVRSKK